MILKIVTACTKCNALHACLQASLDNPVKGCEPQHRRCVVGQSLFAKHKSQIITCVSRRLKAHMYQTSLISTVLYLRYQLSETSLSLSGLKAIQRSCFLVLPFSLRKCITFSSTRKCIASRVFRHIVKSIQCVDFHTSTVM